MASIQRAILAAIVLTTGCSGGAVLHDDPEAAREEAIRAAGAPHVAQAEAAERAGNRREALTHYVAAVQALPAGEIGAYEFDLRSRVIRLVETMDPAPAIPPEALQHFAIGEAAAKAAKNEVAYDRAVGDFAKGLRLAPWDSQANYNVGVLYDLQGRLDPAIRWLRLYTLAAPGASDVPAVRTKIAELEVKKRNSGVEALVGIWRIDSKYFHYVCELDPKGRRNHVVFYKVAARDIPEWKPPYAKGERHSYLDGTPVITLMRLEGRNLVPVCRFHRDCLYFESEDRNAENVGLLSPDLRRVVFKFHGWRHRSPYPPIDAWTIRTQEEIFTKE